MSRVSVFAMAESLATSAIVPSAFAVALVALAIAAPARAAAPPIARMAFVRGDSVWIADADGSHAKPFARGDAPELSADGARLAFVTEDSAGVQTARRIALADLGGRRITWPRALAGGDPSAAAWSPDGRTLLVARQGEAGPTIDAARADGSEPRTLVSGSQGRTLEAPCWSPDGRSFWCREPDSLLRFAPDGRRLGAWALGSLVPGGAFHTGSRLAVLPGGDSLLVAVQSDEPVGREEWQGPAPAIYRISPARHGAKRLTTLGELEWDPCWTRDDGYLCVAFPAFEKDTRVVEGALRSPRRTPRALEARSPASTH